MNAVMHLVKVVHAYISIIHVIHLYLMSSSPILMGATTSYRIAGPDIGLPDPTSQQETLTQELLEGPKGVSVEGELPECPDHRPADFEQGKPWSIYSL